MKTLLFTILIGGMFFTSCKEPDLLGLSDLENNNLYAYFTDTSTVKAFTMIVDSTKTDEPVYNMVGRYEDPFFGAIQASFYTQLMPKQTYYYPSNSKVDSVVLTLAYAGSYGDITKNITLSIFELASDITLANSYYSTSSTLTNNLDLGNQLSVKPNSNDTTITDSVLNIKLNNAIGDKIVKFDSATSSTVANFLSAFKGIKVTSDANENASILYFSLLSKNTKMTIYYNDSLTSEYLVNSSCARYNQIQHQYATSAHPFLVKQAITKDTINTDSLLFLQTGGGTQIKVYFPYLAEWGKNNVAVSKAELVIPVVTDNSLYYPANYGVSLLEASGKNNISLSYLKISEIYDASNKEYRINVSKYVQDLINGLYPDQGLYIYPYNYTTGLGRSVIKNSNCTKGLRLELTMVNNKP